MSYFRDVISWKRYLKYLENVINNLVVLWTVDTISDVFKNLHLRFDIYVTPTAHQRHTNGTPAAHPQNEAPPVKYEEWHWYNDVYFLVWMISRHLGMFSWVLLWFFIRYPRDFRPWSNFDNWDDFVSCLWFPSKLMTPAASNIFIIALTWIYDF